ncbi:MAG TPA: spirocyclase AveC family protein [Solirubrobacteraceae bacterium]
MNVSSPPVGREATTVARPVAAVTARQVVPVKWWAGIGALVVAFFAYVLISWVTGPHFEKVPVGPSEVPGYMKAGLMAFQILCIPAALGCIYWFVVRPWRRTRTLGVDGVLVIAFATLWVEDPLSAYAGHWFTYNSWALNFGSWVHEVPGWMSFGQPGQMLVEPVLIIPGVYVWVFVLTMYLGSWVMRTASRRWPTLGKPGLIGICFVTMCAFDVVFEGIIFMPLGAWEYPGGHLSIFPSTYHKFPLNEMLTVSSLFTAVAALRYFVNDRGEMIVERGIERVKGGPVKKVALRALAAVAACHLLLIAFYNIPNTVVGMHSTSWPADLQKRSYLTDGLCGEGTDRACPGKGVPLIRNDNSGDRRGGSAYLRLDGTLGVPPGTKLPERVPFDTGG